MTPISSSSRGSIAFTLACGDYDRTRALEEGTIRPDGIDLTYLRLPVEETFFRMLRYREFDCSEMSLSSYCASLHSENPPFIAIPVYPSRVFRHGYFFINTDKGIKSGAAARLSKEGLTVNGTAYAPAAAESKTTPAKSSK